jgi:coenzyme F420 hydrogenase subunit beta
MKSHAGQEFSFSYNEMWEDEARWQLMFRCKICPDSIGDLADITVADVWPGGRPDTEGAGFNGFIARTKRGKDLLEGAVRDGAITISHALGYDGLEQAQGSHMYKKQSITARLAAMRDGGFVVPSFDHLRLEQAAATLTEAERETNYVGMSDRLRAGDNIEPLPVV